MSNIFEDLSSLSSSSDGSDFLKKLGQSTIGNSVGQALSSKITKKISAPQPAQTVIQDKTDYTKPSQVFESNNILYIVASVLVLGGVFFFFRRRK